MIPLGMYFVAQPHEEGQRTFLRFHEAGARTLMKEGLTAPIPAPWQAGIGTVTLGWVAVCVHEPRKGADGQELHLYRVVAVTEDILSAEILLESYEE